MSKFNTDTVGSKTENLAGGEAYQQTPDLELVSLILTSLVKDSFYESESESLSRLKDLIGRNDKKFVAQCAVYARNVFGMRSISHVVASELAKYIAGEQWAKSFYDKVVYRVDDMTEITAYHLANNGKMSNAMRKGFRKAFDKFDRYQLAKYRSPKKAVSLIDLTNMVRPKPSEKNSEALKLLVENKLRNTDTWESKLTKAGQTATSEEEKDVLKKEVWVELINSRRIGYFALLKNLSNILQQSPEIVSQALEMLVDRNLIKNSLVLPFRFLNAIEVVEQLNCDGVRETLIALNEALNISVDNVPTFDGTNLVVIDVSGSMTDGDAFPARVGSLFASILYSKGNFDLMYFNEDAHYQMLNPNDSILTNARRIPFETASTDFKSIFKVANKKYDRIFLLSDMQGWVDYNSPVFEFANYCKRHDASPRVYSFDLRGHGTMQFPQNRVYAVAGFSEKIFDIITQMEQDKNALINEIKKVEL